MKLDPLTANAIKPAGTKLDFEYVVWGPRAGIIPCEHARRMAEPSTSPLPWIDPAELGRQRARNAAWLAESAKAYRQVGEAARRARTALRRWLVYIDPEPE